MGKPLWQILFQFPHRSSHFGREVIFPSPIIKRAGLKLAIWSNITKCTMAHQPNPASQGRLTSPPMGWFHVGSTLVILSCQYESTPCLPLIWELIFRIALIWIISNLQCTTYNMAEGIWANRFWDTSEKIFWHQSQLSRENAADIHLQLTFETTLNALPLRIQGPLHTQWKMGRREDTVQALQLPSGLEAQNNQVQYITWISSTWNIVDVPNYPHHLFFLLMRLLLFTK